MDNVTDLYLHPYHLHRNNLRWIYSWLTYYEHQLEVFPTDAQLNVQLKVLQRMDEEYHNSPRYSHSAEVIPFPHRSRRHATV